MRSWKPPEGQALRFVEQFLENRRASLLAQWRFFDSGEVVFMRRVLAVVLLSSVAVLTQPLAANAQSVAAAPAITYPQTKTVDLVETQFGVPVADPYRWLENDVRNDPEVANWVEAENQVTNRFLQTLPLRDW